MEEVNSSGNGCLDHFKFTGSTDFTKKTIGTKRTMEKRTPISSTDSVSIEKVDKANGEMPVAKSNSFGIS